MTLQTTYGFPDTFLYAGDDKIIPSLSKLGKACRSHVVQFLGQLFHAGLAVRFSHDGSHPQVFSASDVADHRCRVVQTPMPNGLVWKFIEAYVVATTRLAQAGLDGVETFASRGYLIACLHFSGEFNNRSMKSKLFTKEVTDSG